MCFFQFQLWNPDKNNSEFYLYTAPQIDKDGKDGARSAILATIFIAPAHHVPIISELPQNIAISQT